MARNVRVSINQNCAVLGKSDMAQATRDLHNLIAWARNEHDAPPPPALAKLAHELSCVTEVWPDDPVTRTANFVGANLARNMGGKSTHKP